MKLRLIVPVVVILLLGFFLIWWFQPERVVTRRVQSLFKAATVQEGAGEITKGTRGQAIEKYLAERVTLNGPADGEEEYSHDSYSRSDLIGMYSGLAQNAKSIEIANPQILSVDVEGDSATVEASADLNVEVASQKIIQGNQAISMTWVKNHDGWQLSKAAWKKTGH